MEAGSGRALTKETVKLSIAVLRRAKESKTCTAEEEQGVRHLYDWLASLEFEESSDSDDSLDAPSRALLADYRCSERYSIRQAKGLGELMGSSPSLRNSAYMNLNRNDEKQALTAELDQLSDWAGFDVFKVRDLSDGWPLTTVAAAIIERFDLITKLNLKRSILISFLKDVEKAYKDNPYHNSTHAADVTQSLGCLLSNDDFSRHLTDIELLAMIIAAAVHDVGHPGVSNDFLVASASESALEYNDIHVNENMHAALAFKLFLKPGNNFLPEGMDSQMYQYFRRTVISIVLATDMAGHEELVNEFQTSLRILGPELSAWPVDKRVKVMQMVVHCSDISNPAKPIQLCSQWSDRVLREFFAQGDREKREGMQVSPQCDREQVNCARSQLLFLERVVKPCFATLKALAPNSSHTALIHAGIACKHWEKVIREESDSQAENSS